MTSAPRGYAMKLSLDLKVLLEMAYEQATNRKLGVKEVAIIAEALNFKGF